jgi:hypothetical protein
MWHKLEFSSEKIESLIREMQRLRDEATRLMLEANAVKVEVRPYQCRRCGEEVTRHY